MGKKGGEVWVGDGSGWLFAVNACVGDNGRGGGDRKLEEVISN